ncbi:hypothetical protein GLOIN_2v1873945 [Rhizophagus irregularis DAOM 181602=DAOM 197198]|uniref:Uncharacterized protein n=3 Tax=Rhizophagus irregularis TaxID=588596 RepID=A0A2P4Q8R0_RHIID|nr:hypothetical protein GLOIN_2v1873945 [Rhizophagus irregularis DAOM 181602=DAOM 197198]POG74033.1 hypothetical protein GLOIN_2v1873945 [Rhizophagus irregularis DAOM 181602=DAOM 197198]CAG8653839.1 4252_t:CDS:2 [Rhizophagus irregularis]|eukprot:XP_025180899.1 hypothetical protein GLOIN_2v1873945 [Rhizophagus irregularis DAOM 181602=DAOM 197198]
MTQLRDYYAHQSPYDASYTRNIDTPLKWWRTCEVKPPFFQHHAIKLTRRTRIFVKNLEAISRRNNFGRSMAEVNLEQTAIDDDLEIIDDEPLELEETLDLSNPKFLQNATTPAVERDENDDSVDYTSWLIEFDKEDDYDSAELAKMYCS